MLLVTFLCAIYSRRKTYLQVVTIVKKALQFNGVLLSIHHVSIKMEIPDCYMLKSEEMNKSIVNKGKQTAVRSERKSWQPRSDITSKSYVFFHAQFKSKCFSISLAVNVFVCGYHIAILKTSSHLMLHTRCDQQEETTNKAITFSFESPCPKDCYSFHEYSRSLIGLCN